MRGLGTSTIDIYNNCILMIWSLACLMCLVLMVFALVFPLGININTLFPKVKPIMPSLLKLVHSDLMIFPYPSFTEARYALTFINDFLRHTWVYFLKYKSDVFAHFKFFKALVENQSFGCIKNLCTNNGGVLRH